jgi:hypothetical protein
MADYKYFPDRNARAYATPFLIERLGLLLKLRSAKSKSNYSLQRWRETQAIATVLAARGVGAELVGRVERLGPEVAPVKKLPKPKVLKMMPVPDFLPLFPCQHVRTKDNILVDGAGRGRCLTCNRARRKERTKQVQQQRQQAA